VVYRPLLGRDLEAENGMAALAVQRRRNHTSTTAELLLSKHIPMAVVTHAMGETGWCLRVLCQGVIKGELGQPVS
jgi:hypothetical protein